MFVIVLTFKILQKPSRIFSISADLYMKYSKFVLELCTKSKKSGSDRNLESKFELKFLIKNFVEVSVFTEKANYLRFLNFFLEFSVSSWAFRLTQEVWKVLHL